MQLPELLAPVGSLDKLKIAVSYGADAVYLAGQSFGLRQGAENFSLVELEEGVAFAQQYGVKVYVVLNAFLHDEDLADLPEFVQFLERIEVDAVIVSDLGVITIVQQHSTLAIHLSTQASCLNAYGAKLWKNLGVQRIIVGREISISEAGLIKQQAGIEIEQFIHGAMCMAYSGNCTLSNYTAGRDSNRGGCIQSCRFSYQLKPAQSSSTSETWGENTFMSSKDLRGLALLPKFMQHGIDSIKIEGRMKSQLYLATVIRAYRQALDSYREREQWRKEHLYFWEKELEKVPHREYTQGSLAHPPSADSIYSANQSDHKNTQYEVAGTVVETIPNESITLMVLAGFSATTELEFLPFDGQQTPTLHTAGMKNILHQPIEKAKPNTLVVLPYHHAIKPWNLARKKIA